MKCTTQYFLYFCFVCFLCSCERDLAYIDEQIMTLEYQNNRTDKQNDRSLEAIRQWIESRGDASTTNLHAYTLAKELHENHEALLYLIYRADRFENDLENYHRKLRNAYKVYKYQCLSIPKKVRFEKPFNEAIDKSFEHWMMSKDKISRSIFTGHLGMQSLEYTANIYLFISGFPADVAYARCFHYAMEMRVDTLEGDSYQHSILIQPKISQLDAKMDFSIQYRNVVASTLNNISIQQSPLGKSLLLRFTDSQVHTEIPITMDTQTHYEAITGVSEEICHTKGLVKLN